MNLIRLFSVPFLVFLFTACGYGVIRFDDGLNDSSGDNSDNSADIVIGQAVYENRCMKCHGSTGGNGWADDMRGTPRTELASVIRNGRGIMSGFSQEQISDAELEHLIAYVETL